MKKYYRQLMLATLTLLAIGCGSSFTEGPSGQQGNTQVLVPPPVVPTTKSHLRIVNGVGTTQNFIVSIDGAQVDGDLDGLESTQYIELNPGQHTVRIATATVAAGQATTTVLERQVTTTANQYASFIIRPATKVAARSEEIRAAQLPGDTDVLFVTDDVVTVANTLRARLVNIEEFRNPVQLENQAGTRLLGPVAQNAAGPYEAVAATDLQNSPSLRAQFLDAVGNDAFSRIFTQAQGTASPIVSSLGNLFSAAGNNLTVIVCHQATGVTALLVLVDDANNGNQSVISLQANDA